MAEIPGYTDLEMIGQGGFAIVYRARQVSVGRDVAIKLLTDPAPDDDLVRRFHRESQAVGALSWHPHIAAVVDAGSTADGQAYIVFELLPGGSLEDRIQTAPLTWTEAVSSMIQVADAVEAAHRDEVLHRDIKPANILLDRLGVAKLGDFGIASMQDGNKTETGMLATTVAHAAPELFNGHPASAATDVYALGSTLHTLLSGSAPFQPEGNDTIARTISRIMTDPPPRLDANTAPDEVTTVISHALAKQPQYRPRSAGAFGQALQQAQHALGIAVTAMPVTDAGPAHRHDASAHKPTDESPHVPAPLAPEGERAPNTQDVSFAAPPMAAPTQSRPTRQLGGVILTLAGIAVLLAAVVTALVLYQTQREPGAIAVTDGGARIRSYEPLASTEMEAPFSGVNAVDRSESTYWGVQPGIDGARIVGTSYVIGLSENYLVTRVGISNGAGGGLGRVSSVQWGTGLVDGQLVGPVVEHEVANDAGAHFTGYNTRTNQIVLVITGVHDDADMVGIAEILIEVEGANQP